MVKSIIREHVPHIAEPQSYLFRAQYQHIGNAIDWKRIGLVYHSDHDSLHLKLKFKKLKVVKKYKIHAEHISNSLGGHPGINQTLKYIQTQFY